MGIDPAQIAVGSAIGNLTSRAIDKASKDETSEEAMLLRLILAELRREVRAEEEETDHKDTPLVLSFQVWKDFDYSPFGHVSLWAPANTNILIRLPSGAPADIAVTLPASKFTAIEQPGTGLMQLSLAGAGPDVNIWVRASSERWGSVLP